MPSFGSPRPVPRGADLPEYFGNWNSVWRRLDRWANKGVWQRVFAILQDPDLEWVILDSTAIRAHPHAAGTKKTRVANLTGEAQESTNFYGKRSRLLAVCATK